MQPKSTDGCAEMRGKAEKKDLSVKETTTRRQGKGHKSLGQKHFNPDLLQPIINSEDVPAPPASTVLSMANVPDGGKLVSVRDPAGKYQVRIEYEREQLLKLAASPFAVLPPSSIKEIVVNMPELIASFPVRHHCD